MKRHDIAATPHDFYTIDFQHFTRSAASFGPPPRVAVPLHRATRVDRRRNITIVVPESGTAQDHDRLCHHMRCIRSVHFTCLREGNRHGHAPATCIPEDMPSSGKHLFRPLPQRPERILAEIHGTNPDSSAWTTTLTTDFALPVDSTEDGTDWIEPADCPPIVTTTTSLTPGELAELLFNALHQEQDFEQHEIEAARQETLDHCLLAATRCLESDAAASQALLHRLAERHFPAYIPSRHAARIHMVSGTPPAIRVRPLVRNQSP